MFVKTPGEIDNALRSVGRWFGSNPGSHIIKVCSGHIGNLLARKLTTRVFFHRLPRGSTSFELAVPYAVPVWPNQIAPRARLCSDALG